MSMLYFFMKVAKCVSTDKANGVLVILIKSEIAKLTN